MGSLKQNIYIYCNSVNGGKLEDKSYYFLKKYNKNWDIINNVWGDIDLIASEQYLPDFQFQVYVLKIPETLYKKYKESLELEDIVRLEHEGISW